jgi:hypothetical protein
MKEMGTNHFPIGIKGTVIRTSGVFISVAWDNLKQRWSFYEKTCQDKLVYLLLLAKHNPGDKCCWGKKMRQAV